MQGSQALWYLTIGVIMGVFSGLLGIGGGVVAVPLMMYALKMNTKLAMGTSLAIIVPVAISGSFKHYMQGHVNLNAAALIAVSGIVFAYLGAMLNHRLPEVWLRRFFAVFIIVIAVKLLLGSLGARAPEGVEAVAISGASSAGLLLYFGIGATMGLLSGLLGIGGGVVAVPLLMLAAGMDAKMAMGTSLAVIIPVAISGSIKQFRQGNLRLKAAALIAFSGIFAAYLGAYLNHRLPTQWLEGIFGAFLLFISFKMLLPKRAAPPAPAASTGLPPKS